MIDWNAIITGVVATVVGLLLTAGARLLDRWLPDPDGKHPIPEPHLPELPSAPSSTEHRP